MGRAITEGDIEDMFNLIISDPDLLKRFNNAIMIATSAAARGLLDDPEPEEVTE